MKGAKTVVLSLLALAALLLLIGFMAGIFRDRIEPDTAQIVAVSPGAGYALEQSTETAFEVVPASVEAKETTIVASRLLARIDDITVRAGDYVDAGQLLVRLQQGDLEARVGQAEEGVRSLEARQAEAQRTLQRTIELRGRQLVAEAELDAAQANAMSLEAELAASRQALAETRAALGYAEVRSPLDGRIVDRFAEPGDTVTPGQKILSLYNPFSLRVEAWVRESLALKLAQGQYLTVLVPALERQLQARIEEIVPAADPGSRAFRIRAILPGEPGLLPGMYARIRVPAGERRLLLAPLDYIAEVGQLNVVWVRSEGGALRRFVRLGDTREGGSVEVVAGLKAGDVLLPPPARGGQPDDAGG